MKPTQENGAKWQPKAPQKPISSDSAAQEAKTQDLKARDRQSSETGVTPQKNQGDDGRHKTQENAPDVDEEQAP